MYVQGLGLCFVAVYGEFCPSFVISLNNLLNFPVPFAWEQKPLFYTGFQITPWFSSSHLIPVFSPP